jgi:hypothetical protein
VLPGSSEGGIQNLEVQPVLGGALPDVARFLHGWHARRDQGSSVQRPEDPLSIERRLRWLQWLLVENPLSATASPHGLCIRDASGVIVGLLLSFPGVFLAGDQRLRGLGSGSFFVEPHARTLGFYLFKRYLNSPGYSFFFSTTCNTNSSALWAKLGACAVPNSDTEFVLPLKLEVVLPFFLAGRTSSAFAAEIARVVGRCANPILQLLARKSAELTIEPCRDWEKLAELFRRHRCAARITTDRSAAFLQWRYGPSSQNHPFDICVFRDKRGNEGWFALGSVIREPQRPIQLQRPIRGCVLLDAIWPRETMSFRDLLPAILQRAASKADGKADAIFFQPRPGLDAGECGRWIIPCGLEAPKVFAIPRKGGAPLAVSSLDLVPADGDGYF